MLCATHLLRTFALFIVSATLGHAQAGGQPQLLAMVTPPSFAGAPTKAKTMLLIGRVETTMGVLPGAVIEVQSNQRLRAVTDADGFFHLTVPAGTGPVGITASYAGYQDVNTSLTPGTQPTVLRLVVPHDIKLPRRQRLNTCLRIARRQVKRQLRQIRS